MIRLYVNEDDFSKFTRDFSSGDVKKPSKPYELKHTFDISKNEYVTNEDNCCYFTPISNVEDIVITSSDSNVVRVTKDYIICDNRGTSTLTIRDKKGNRARKSLLVTVYTHNPTISRKRRSIFLEKDSMIEISNFLRHCHCPHIDNCLFREGLFDIEYSSITDEIWNVQKTIKDLEFVSESYLNGSILYHPTLDDCYDINVSDDFSVSVNVTGNFMDRIKSEIRKCNIVLRDLNMMKRRNEL